MRAPRFLACSRLSTTRIPAPSPITNPSRPLSKGRLARVGSSLRAVDSACAELNPAMATGVTLASVPPQIIASTLPNRMRFTASMKEWPAEEQADTTP